MLTCGGGARRIADVKKGLSFFVGVIDGTFRADRECGRVGRNQRARRLGALILNEIFVEKKIEGPLERDPDLFFETREFTELNRPPKPPREKTRKVETENTCDSRATTDRREQTERGKSEWFQFSTAHHRDDILGEHGAFSRSVLRRGRVKRVFLLNVWNKRAVAERPDFRVIRHA